MIGLFQGKLTTIEFIFGVLIAVSGGVVKAINNNGGLKEAVKNGLMGFFVAIVSGLVFIEYFNSSTIIVASMGLSGYSGASFLDAINALGKTMKAFREALDREEIINEKRK